MPETDVLIENDLISLTDFKDFDLTYMKIKEIFKNARNINKRKNNQLLSHKYFSAEKHFKNIMRILNSEL